MKNLIGRIFFFIGICMIGFGVLSAPKFMDVFYLCVIPGIILVVLFYKPAKRYGQWMKEVEIAGKERRRKAANAVRAQIIGTGDKPSTISTWGSAWPVRRLAACGAVLQVRLPLNGKDTQNSL